MTWSYNTTLSASKDKVRFLIGDTDINDQLLQDEEITFILAEDHITNNYQAAAQLAYALAVRFARDVDTKVDSVSSSSSQRAERYLVLAKRLDSKAKGVGGALGTPLVGGVSESAMIAVRDSADRVLPAFRSGQHDNPPGNIDNDGDLTS